MTSDERMLVATVNTLLLEGASMGMSFDNLKLQKLLYLSYATHLKNGGKILDYLPFEAWNYGPVIPDVYYYYKDRGVKGWDVIKKKMVHDGVYPVLKNNKSIRETLERYGNVDGSKLIDLTHKPGGAWHEAFSVQHNARIDHRAIKNEFTASADKDNLLIRDTNDDVTPKDRPQKSKNFLRNKDFRFMCIVTLREIVDFFFGKSD